MTEQNHTVGTFWKVLSSENCGTKIPCPGVSFLEESFEFKNYKKNHREKGL